MVIKILFERRRGVYLPEIDAYRTYLETNFKNIKVDVFEGLKAEANKDYDVIWKFLGNDFLTSSENQILVHEYGSLSVPPFPKIKNYIKRKMNRTPFQRVFLNDLVENEMGFKDSTKSFIRDMGVSERFFHKTKVRKEYDFVYCGSLYRDQSVLRFLDQCSRNNLGKILVIGDIKKADSSKLKRSGNIVFTGKVPYSDVPELLSSARYGLNIIPDMYPFNIQTSTKVLEYLAAKLPVISNKYRWIQEFELNKEASFYWIPQKIEELSLSKIEKHKFVVPNVENLSWNSVITASKVFDFLKGL